MVKAIWIKDRAQMERISRLAWDAPYEIYLRAGSAAVDARDLTEEHMAALVGRKVWVVAGDRVDPTHFGYMVEEMEGARKASRSLRQRMREMARQLEPHYGWELRMKRIQC